MNDHAPDPRSGFQQVAADPWLKIPVDHVTDPSEARKLAYCFRSSGMGFYDGGGMAEHQMFIDLANALEDYAARLEAGAERLGRQFAEDVEAWRGGGE